MTSTPPCPDETALLQRLYGILGSEEYSCQYAVAMRSDSELTQFMKKVIVELARQMDMNVYSEYYTIDHVLYKEEDRIPTGILPFETSRVEGTWLKRFRVAFEHENRLDSAGGYQEIAKLMLINADMKVLMGYAEKGENYDVYAKEYQAIFSSVPASASPILFIGEYLDMHADAYLIMSDCLMKYDWEQATWYPCA